MAPDITKYILYKGRIGGLWVFVLMTALSLNYAAPDVPISNKNAAL